MARPRTAPRKRCARPEVASCRGIPLDELFRDDDALHLVGALADAGQRRVAVQPLDVELPGIAVGAVDAHALDRVFQRRLAGEIFRHAGFHVAALAAVESLSCIEREKSCRTRARRHLAELELDRLMLADRLAERLAKLRIVRGKLQRALGNADAARGDVDAAELQSAGDL